MKYLQSGYGAEELGVSLEIENREEAYICG